jgi:hypothetical protein
MVSVLSFDILMSKFRPYLAPGRRARFGYDLSSAPSLYPFSMLQLSDVRPKA